jgi:plasmid stability protein
MEEEARQVLSAALSDEPKRALNLAESIRRHIKPLGGVDLELPVREPIRNPPNFE